MTNKEKLALAIKIITEVKNEFNNEVEKCECCGFEKFINYNERQMREQLNGAITRIKRVAERMERKEY